MIIKRHASMAWLLFLFYRNLLIKNLVQKKGWYCVRC